MDADLLAATGLTRRFGGVYAVRDVTLAVTPGQTHAVIGPNGAGKSTLFRMIGGQLPPSAGSVRFAGTTIDRLPAHRRARLGIAAVFQETRVFRGLTAMENVMVGAHATTGAGAVSAVLRLPRHYRDERLIRERAAAALDQVGLAGSADRLAEVLPLGQQRAVQLARALCVLGSDGGRPRLLLLDEPASGLRAAERIALARLVEQLRAGGLSILLIEHDVAFVARLADRVTVLDLGRVIASGTFADVRVDPRVTAAYLGGTR
jgi:ABC-type branched-subunit amino acid transport system ATPase component